MKTLIITITCLTIITNISFSQHKQFGEDTFYNSFSDEGNYGPSLPDNESPDAEHLFEVNLQWNYSESINKVILVKKDQSEITFIGGIIEQNLIVKNLSKGIYYVGYYFNNVCVSQETIEVGDS